MKILRFKRNIFEPLPPAMDAPCGGMEVELIADSATNRNRRPVFIPDFAREGWVIELLPAIHIARLGKFIAPRFADRYISGISICALLRPGSAEKEGSILFDSALTIGEIQPYLKEAGMKIAGELEPLQAADVADDKQTDRGSVSAFLTAEQLAAEEMVARASMYCTLKSGDIILPASVGISFPALLNHTLTATLNSIPTISTRLK